MKNKYTLKLRTIETVREKLGRKVLNFTMWSETEGRGTMREKSLSLHLILFSTCSLFSWLEEKKFLTEWMAPDPKLHVTRKSFFLRRGVRKKRMKFEEGERENAKVVVLFSSSIFTYSIASNPGPCLWTIYSFSSLCFLFSPLFSNFFFIPFPHPSIHPLPLPPLSPSIVNFPFSFFMLRTGWERKRIRASFCKEKRFTMAWESSV